VPRLQHDRLVRVVIIECGLCQQPWEVPIDAVNGQRFQLPNHPMLDLETNEPTGERCSGQRVAGVAAGERADWEAYWPLNHPGRRRPPVLDGSTSVTILK
jgi:hypothetical protein